VASGDVGARGQRISVTRWTGAATMPPRGGGDCAAAWRWRIGAAVAGLGLLCHDRLGHTDPMGRAGPPACPLVWIKAVVGRNRDCLRLQLNYLYLFLQNFKFSKFTFQALDFEQITFSNKQRQYICFQHHVIICFSYMCSFQHLMHSHVL